MVMATPRPQPTPQLPMDFERPLGPALEKVEVARKNRDSWGKVISYGDGFAWGISETGETICLGTETAVKEAIADSRLKCGDSIKDGIIELERKLEKESKYGADAASQFRAIKARGQRSRPTRNLKHRTTSVKRGSFGKRLPSSKNK